jgi:hypothetical protein
MSAASDLNFLWSTIYRFFLWSTITRAKARGRKKGKCRGERSPLGEHTLYGVKYSVLYFTLKYHGEKRNEVVK